MQFPDKPARSQWALGAIFAFGLLLTNAGVRAEVPVAANEANLPIGEESLPPMGGDDAQLVEERAPVRIMIGPQFVQPGAAMHAQRSTVGGKASVVVFSASPPMQSRSLGGAIGLPSGMPVSARLTSGFGWRTHPISGSLRAHSGVDLAASYGAPIVATGDGIVGTAGWSGGYGLLVAISHGDGVQTRYGHMSRVNVFPGQQVRRGDVIGYVGSTGQSTGPHVHYEVRINGAAINPLAQ